MQIWGICESWRVLSFLCIACFHSCSDNYNHFRATYKSLFIHYVNNFLMSHCVWMQGRIMFQCDAVFFNHEMSLIHIGATLRKSNCKKTKTTGHNVNTIPINAQNRKKCIARNEKRLHNFSAYNENTMKSFGGRNLSCQLTCEAHNKNRLLNFWAHNENSL